MYRIIQVVKSYCYNTSRYLQNDLQNIGLRFDVIHLLLFVITFFLGLSSDEAIACASVNNGVRIATHKKWSH